MVDQYSSFGIGAISDNAAGFSRALMGMADHVDGNMEAVIRKACIDLYTRIVKRTPVDTGRAKASWTISTTEVEIERTGKFYDPSDIAGIISENVREFDVSIHDDTVTISTNLEYMEFLENGSSEQAPYGMVSLSLAEFEAFFNNALKGLEGIGPA